MRPSARRVAALATLLLLLLVSNGAAPVEAGEPMGAAGLTTSVEKLTLLDVHERETSDLAPLDTFYLDVRLKDSNGFRSVTTVDASISLGSLPWTGWSTWQGTTIQWRRTGVPRWRVSAENAEGWDLLESLCRVDTTTNTTGSEILRFAFVPTSIARASTNGWRISAWSGLSFKTITDLAMRERVTWVPLDTLGRFSPGAPGSSGLPLSLPTTGSLQARLVTNVPLTLRGSASAFVGTPGIGSRFGGGPADTLLRWTLQDTTDAFTGYLDSLGVVIGDPIPANVDTAGASVRLRLGLRLPPALPAQDYLARLGLAVESSSGDSHPSFATPLQATVIGAGAAATSAVGEVEPRTVVAGVNDQPLLARLALTVTGSATGVNRVRVALPAGWADARITSVTDALGTPVPHHDASRDGSAVAALHATIGSGTLHVFFTSDVPGPIETSGAAFPVFFDDTTSAAPEQVATEGDVDGNGGSGWHVRATPAAAARLELSPANASVLVGDVVPFTALVTDAFGNVRADAVTWSATGSAGTVDGSGIYTAQAAGTSVVIARSGAFADTSSVLVTDPSSGLRVTPLASATGRLLPGGAVVEIARFRVNNDGTVADTVISVDLGDVSHGPPGPKQREDSWLKFELRNGSDTRLATGFWDSDRVRFDGLRQAIPAASSRTFVVYASASTHARDGDSLALEVDSGASVTLQSHRPVALDAGSPVDRFPVDGMSAAQVTLEAVTGRALFAGARRQAVAVLRLPGNGYAADRLTRMDMINRGTARPVTDLSRIEAWLDNGDRALDTLSDQRLGSLLFTGDRWQITGLSVDVPDTGRLVLLSVDVDAGAGEGRTLQMALPSLPDVGLGMTSGNSGPIDREVAMERDLVIGGGERVLVAATPIAAGVVRPGDTGVPLLDLLISNGYSGSRHVRSLVIANATVGAGTQGQRDGVFSRVGLSQHALHSSEVFLTSAPVAVGSFSGGALEFGGLDLVVGPGAELRLRVWGDVDGAAATDGDLLAASIVEAQDLGFTEATTVGGSWPMSSGAAWTVDGFSAAQCVVHPLPGLTLAPLDGPVAAIDFTLPANGYLADVLHSVRVANLGDASPAEVAELRLFRDGGDGHLGGAASDDIDLGALVPIGGQWQSAYLVEPVPVGGRRYFVAMTVAGSTSDSSLVRLAIPAGGVEMESGNDGPIDGALANPEPHVLSTRPLLANLSLDPASSTLGQGVDVRMLVRNVGAETFLNVAPTAPSPEGTADYTLLAGPTPASADIAPGDSAVFMWSLAPTTAGDLRFAATAAGTGATSLLERRTLVAHSGANHVFMESDSLRLVPLQSMPSAVNLGQAGVVPLTLTLEHPGDASSTDITFRRLRVRLEQEDGSPIAPAQLASAVEVREGTTVYLRRTSLETTGGEMDLTLTTPVTLRPGDPVSLALQLDVSASTSISTFRFVIPDSTGFVAEDAISSRPVRVRLEGQSYPIRSGLARLLAGGGSLAVSSPSPVRRHASNGQSHVPLATWQIEHSSQQATSADLRLNALIVRAARSSAGGTPPWARWRVYANNLAVAVHAAAVGDTGDVRLDLMPAPIVQPGGSTTLRLEADLADAGAGEEFRLNGVRTAQWDVRDVNTGDPAPLSGPATLEGDTVRVESPAPGLLASPIPRMPATVAAGRTRLPVLDLVLHHPGPAEAASIRTDSLRVVLQAPDGRALPMTDHLSALRVTRRGVTLASLVAPAGAVASFAITHETSASTFDTLTVEVDVVGAAVAGTVELRVFDGAWRASDANTSTPVSVTPEPPAGWPFGSGAGQLVAPARELRVHLRSELPSLVPADGATPVRAASLVLVHPGPAGSGPIAVDHLVVGAIDANGAALALGNVASSLDLRRGGTLIAQSAALTTDSLTAVMAFGSPLEIAANDSVVLALDFRPRAANAAQRFRLGWRSDGIGVVQPTSAVLAIAVLPASGFSFPLWTESAGFAAADLAGSYTNFPNPFAAGRDATTFAFLMPTSGRATLRIWTPRGEAVVTLLDSATLSAGLHQSERWDGRNGRGATVANGVYVAELDVTLDDGRHERVLRKVAVVR